MPKVNSPIYPVLPADPRIAVNYSHEPITVKYVNGGTTAAFYVYYIPRDGDCGYHCLKVPRSVAADQLKAKIRPGAEYPEDKAIREMVARDIANAITIEESATENKESQERQLPASLRADERFKVIIEKTKQFLEGKETSENLVSACAEVNVFKACVEHCVSKPVFLSFILGQSSVLDAIARLNNLNVDIVIRNNDNFEVAHSFVSKPGNRKITLLYEDKHFNLLMTEPGLQIFPVETRPWLAANPSYNPSPKPNASPSPIPNANPSSSPSPNANVNPNPSPKPQPEATAESASALAKLDSKPDPVSKAKLEKKNEADLTRLNGKSPLPKVESYADAQKRRVEEAKLKTETPEDRLFSAIQELNEWLPNEGILEPNCLPLSSIYLELRAAYNRLSDWGTQGPLMHVYLERSTRYEGALKSLVPLACLYQKLHQKESIPSTVSFQSFAFDMLRELNAFEGTFETKKSLPPYTTISLEDKKALKESMMRLLVTFRLLKPNPGMSLSFKKEMKGFEDPTLVSPKPLSHQNLETLIIESVVVPPTPPQTQPSFKFKISKKGPNGKSKLLKEWMIKPNFVEPWPRILKMDVGSKGVDGMEGLVLSIDEKGTLEVVKQNENYNWVFNLETSLQFSKDFTSIGFLKIKAAKTVTNHATLKTSGGIIAKAEIFRNRGIIQAPNITLLGDPGNFNKVSLDNRGGEINAAKLLTVRQGGIDNRGGYLLGKNSHIHTTFLWNQKGSVNSQEHARIFVKESLNNSKGWIEGEKGVLIRNSNGKVKAQNSSKISSDGEVILSASHIETDDTSLIRGKVKTDLTGKTIRLATPVKGKSVSLSGEHVEILSFARVNRLNIEQRSERPLYFRGLMISQDFKAKAKGYHLLKNSVLRANTISLEGNAFHRGPLLNRGIIRGEILHFGVTDFKHLEGEIFCNQDITGLFTNALIKAKIETKNALTLEATSNVATVITKNAPRIQIEADLTAKTLSLRGPKSELIIGAPKTYSILEADSIEIESGPFELRNGKLISKNGDMNIESNGIMKLGKACDGQSMPCNITSAAKLKLKSSRLMEWFTLEMDVRGDFEAEAPLIDDISSNITIAGEAFLNTPLNRHRLLIRTNPGGYKVAWTPTPAQYMLHESFKYIGHSSEALTKPAFFAVSGKLSTRGKTEIFASQLYSVGFEGEKPQLTSFVPENHSYTSYTCGRTKRRKCNTLIDPYDIYGTPIVATASYGAKLTSRSGGIYIDGIVTTLGADLTGVKNALIGITNSLIKLPPQRTARNFVPLTDFMWPSADFQKAPRDYPTIFRSLLPLPLEDYGPLIILRPDGSLMPNISNRRPLHSDCKIMKCLTRAFMSELKRGFLDKDHTTPKEMYKKLKCNAGAFFEEMLRTGVKKPLSAITEPMIVYQEIEYRDEDGVSEMALTPILRLPASYHNPKLMDGAGGLFCYGDLLIAGTDRNTSILRITGHVEADGQIVIRTFNRVSVEKRVVEERYEVVENIKISRGCKKSKRITNHKTVVKRTSQVGATFFAKKGVRIYDTETLNIQGANLGAGEEGFTVQNVGTITETAALQSNFKPFTAKVRGKRGKGIKVEGFCQKNSIVPSTFYSKGSIYLRARNIHLNSLQAHSEGDLKVEAENTLTVGMTTTTSDKPPILANQKGVCSLTRALATEAHPPRFYGKKVVFTSEGTITLHAPQLFAEETVSIQAVGDIRLLAVPLSVEINCDIVSGLLSGVHVKQTQTLQGGIPTVISAPGGVEIRSLEGNVYSEETLINSPPEWVVIKADNGDVILATVAFLHEPLEKEEDQAKAKKKQKKKMILTIVGIFAGAVAAAFGCPLLLPTLCGPATATATATGVAATTSATAAAASATVTSTMTAALTSAMIKGAVMGAVSSAFSGRNIAKGALESAGFGAVGFGVTTGLTSAAKASTSLSAVFKAIPQLKPTLVSCAIATLQTAKNGGNLLENLIVSSAATSIAHTIIPVSEVEPGAMLSFTEKLTEVAVDATRCAIAGVAASAVAGEKLGASLAAGLFGAAQAAAAGFGDSVGTRAFESKVQRDGLKGKAQTETLKTKTQRNVLKAHTKPSNPSKSYEPSHPQRKSAIKGSIRKAGAALKKASRLPAKLKTPKVAQKQAIPNNIPRQPKPKKDFATKVMDFFISPAGASESASASVSTKNKPVSVFELREQQFGPHYSGVLGGNEGPGAAGGAAAVRLAVEAVNVLGDTISALTDAGNFLDEYPKRSNLEQPKEKTFRKVGSDLLKASELTFLDWRSTYKRESERAGKLMLQGREAEAGFALGGSVAKPLGVALDLAATGAGLVKSIPKVTAKVVSQETGHLASRLGRLEAEFAKPRLRLDGVGDSVSKSRNSMLKSWETFTDSNGLSARPGSLFERLLLPPDRIQHEALKTTYRQKMGIPNIKDLHLRVMLKNLYRDAAEVGSGSTADAIRRETIKGIPTKGKFHLDKGIKYEKSLERWLRNNPTASPGDRAAVENILLDLKDSLGKKTWYSRTVSP